MLYISRFTHPDEIVDSKLYNVADTDDDTETAVDMIDLVDAVINRGLDIKGVIVSTFMGNRTVQGVETYQNPAFSSFMHAKLKTLCGIEVRCYKGEIVTIVADCKITRGDARLRLSDWGSSMAWNVPIGWMNHDSRSRLIIVLDDKITMIGRQPQVGSIWVRWDIKDLTDESLVYDIYRSLRTNAGVHPANFNNCVFDNEERAEKYKYLFR